MSTQIRLRASDGAAHRDIDIRRLEPGEERLYRWMRLESLKRYPGLFGTTYAETAAQPTLPFEQSIAAGDGENVMFGAFTRGELGGICGLRREQRQRSQHRAELVHMYVAPWLQGNGVASLLIDAVLRHGLDTIGLRQIVLGVVAENEPAVRLYRRIGFREYGRLERCLRTEEGFATQLLMLYERS
jgi:RimJ/RimL family protein N-acetyltransferase